jgi:hypothetical protein
VQLENIEPGHQRIDLIYFATPASPTEIHRDYSEDGVGWYGPEDRDALTVPRSSQLPREGPHRPPYARTESQRFTGPSNRGGSRSWGR